MSIYISIKHLDKLILKKICVNGTENTKVKLVLGKWKMISYVKEHENLIISNRIKSLNHNFYFKMK